MVKRIPEAYLTTVLPLVPQTVKISLDCVMRLTEGCYNNKATWKWSLWLL